MTINEIMKQHHERELFFAAKEKIKPGKPVKVVKVRKPREDKGKPRVKYKPTLPMRYRQYIGRANQKGLTFALTTEEFNHILGSQCVYCGSGSRITIDRVDSSLGYVIDNCVPACYVCNMMKYTWDKDEFLGHVVKIYRFNFSR